MPKKQSSFVGYGTAYQPVQQQPAGLGNIRHSSQSPTPALARNVAAGQQASAGPAGMATAGYGAAGQGISPTSPRFGSQSNLGQLNDMSAGPNDPLFGDQFDMSMNKGDDTGVGHTGMWGGPRPQPLPRPLPRPQPIGGPEPLPPNTPWMPGDPRPSPYRPTGGPQPTTPRPNKPWMPGDPRPSPYRPTGGPQPTQPTQPTTPAAPAPWKRGFLDSGGNQFGQPTGGQVPFNQRGPGASVGATNLAQLEQGGSEFLAGVSGSPGAQGQPGPGGGYDPQSDIGGFFGSPQPPPMSGQPGPGGGYDPESDVGGFFGDLERQPGGPGAPTPMPQPGFRPPPTPPSPPAHQFGGFGTPIDFNEGAVPTPPGSPPAWQGPIQVNPAIGAPPATTPTDPAGMFPTERPPNRLQQILQGAAGLQESTKAALAAQQQRADEEGLNEMMGRDEDFRGGNRTRQEIAKARQQQAINRTRALREQRAMEATRQSGSTP